MSIGLVWLVLAICSGVIVYKLPAVYTSEAVIVVDSQKIPEKFVSATVANDLQDRIETIKQQILTSGKLKKIIYDYSLYRDKRKTHFEEEILELMRRDISITLIEGARAGGQGRPGAFRIGYTGSEPTLVAQVANRLANLYVQENLTTREVQAQGTSEFLETQLQEAKRRLDQLEASVSSYKLQHIEELPQQQDALVGALAQLRIQLEANRDAINRAQQTKIILENSLSAAEMSLAGHLRAAEPAGEAKGPDPVVQTATSVPLKKSEVLQVEVDKLRMRYQEEHPDMIRLHAALESALRDEERQPAPDPAVAASGLPPGRMTNRIPVRESVDLARAREQVASLKAQIKATDKELEDRKNDQQRILADINTYQIRVEHLPVREQEMAQITRDYEITKENYKSLLDKKIAAGMALDMERRQKSERFTVIDPARVPEKPVKPKRGLLYGIGMAVSLILATIVGFGAEVRQNVILGEWELPSDIPVLARLPYIALDVSTEKHREGVEKRPS